MLCFLLGAQAISGSLVPPLFWSLGVGVRDAGAQPASLAFSPSCEHSNTWRDSSPRQLKLSGWLGAVP